MKDFDCFVIAGEKTQASLLPTRGLAKRKFHRGAINVADSNLRQDLSF